MKQLLTLLVEHHYLKWYCTNEDLEAVTDLFWAYLTSLDLLCAFPYVLFMDCTYKTNRYCMPFLKIVGLTSTDMTFSMVFMFLQHKRDENFN